MATSEGWRLREIDETNVHCQRFIRLATIAVETIELENEEEWQLKPWELLLAEAQEANRQPIPDSAFVDGEYLGERHF